MKITNSDEQQHIDPTWLHSDRFPRSAKYELAWMLDNEMGPNALWLMEELTSHLELTPGQRVLDLGCGRAATSIFLARELGLRVWATDLWIPADDSWARIVEAGQQDLVCPIRAEAHNLPFAAGFFEAIVSIDSYQYYGTDDTYLGYLSRFLEPGGRLGLVMPALMQEIDGDPPVHLTTPRGESPAFWDPTECWCFHTLDWWRRHLERTGLVEIEHAEVVADGWRLWRDWELIRNGGGFSSMPNEAATLDADHGRFLGLVRLIVRKRTDLEPRSFPHPLLIRL